MQKHKKLIEQITICFVFVVFLAIGIAWLSRANERWVKEEAAAREAERIAQVEENKRLAEIEQGQKMVDEIANEGELYLQWKKGVARDPWGHEFIVDVQNGVWSSVTVTSLGPDGKKDTEDDLKGYKSKGVDVIKAGESVGSGVGRFGIGTVKGLYKAARDELVGEEKPNDAQGANKSGGAK